MVTISFRLAPAGKGRWLMESNMAADIIKKTFPLAIDCIGSSFKDGHEILFFKICSSTQAKRWAIR